MPAATPPLLRLLLNAILRQPDASAAACLAALGISRGCEDASLPSRLLLQMAPPHELVPDMEQRLARAAAGVGILSLRELKLWVVDEVSVTGSLTAIARADADTQLVLRHVKMALEGGAIANLTVAVERDDDDGWGDAAVLSFSGGIR